jgi:hypothetical protein
LSSSLLEPDLTGTYTVAQLRQMATTELGLRTRETRRMGGKALSLSHVYRILTDPFDYGWYWWRGEQHIQI